MELFDERETRMGTRLRLMGAAGLLTLGSLAMGLDAPVALAWPGTYEGPPAQLQAGGDAGFYVWHDGAGNHLATTGPGPEHHFQATISTDGEFAKVGGTTLEGA